MLFESHCHLTHERFAEDRAAVLARAREAGVLRAVTVASDVEDAGRVAELITREAGLWGTAGVHPHEAAAAGPDDVARVRDLLDRERIVAVGETGLDFHYDFSPRDVQRRLFDAHLELAAERELPVVVHSRSADGDMADFVRSCGGRVTGVLHCFTGGRRLLEVALEAGWYVSFTGLVTFKNFDGADLVRAVPRDRLMVETDSPYLAPVPMRGKRNEPSWVRWVAEAVARIRGETVDELGGYTTANAIRFFGLGEGV